MQVNTIQEVIDELNRIITKEKECGSAMGYFPALYLLVTKSVQEGIAKGEFADGPRMERLDVAFANRYLAAYSAYTHAQPCSACWHVAFEDTKNAKLLVIQQMLLGMNAHINLDLGLAAAEVCPGDELPPLQGDFNKINDVLLALTSVVEEELTKINPLMKLVQRYLGKAAVKFVGFSMSVARWFAWQTAKEFAPLPPSDWPVPEGKKDAEVAGLAGLITPKGLLQRWVVRWVRSYEKGTVAENIAILQGLNPTFEQVKARAAAVKQQVG